MINQLMFILLASLIPPTRATSPNSRPGSGERRQGVGRTGRSWEEGVGCQDETTYGADYNGTVNTTLRGRTCQAWSVQEPHAHDKSHYGDHNYCRNPDGYQFPDGVWCLTTDPHMLYEHCPVPMCGSGNLGFPVSKMSNQDVLRPPHLPGTSLVSPALPQGSTAPMRRSAAAGSVAPSPSPAPPPQEPPGGKASRHVPTQPVVWAVRSRTPKVPTTLGRQAQPKEASPARPGRSRGPIDMGKPGMETTTIVGTWIDFLVEFGVTLQTLKYHLTFVLYHFVLN